MLRYLLHVIVIVIFIQPLYLIIRSPHVARIVHATAIVCRGPRCTLSNVKVGHERPEATVLHIGLQNQQVPSSLYNGTGVTHRTTPVQCRNLAEGLLQVCFRLLSLQAQFFDAPVLPVTEECEQSIEQLILRHTRKPLVLFPSTAT